MKNLATLTLILITNLSIAQSSSIKVEGSFTKANEKFEFEKILGEFDIYYICVGKGTRDVLGNDKPRVLAFKLISKSSLGVNKRVFFEEILVSGKKRSKSKFGYSGSWISSGNIYLILEEFETGNVYLRKLNALSFDKVADDKLLFSVRANSLVRSRIFKNQRNEDRVSIAAISPNGSKAILNVQTSATIDDELNTGSSSSTIDLYFLEINGKITELPRKSSWHSKIVWMSNDDWVEINPTSSDWKVLVNKNEKLKNEYELESSDTSNSLSFIYGIRMLVKRVNDKIAVASLNSQGNRILSALLDFNNLKDMVLNSTELKNEFLASCYAWNLKTEERGLKQIDKGLATGLSSGANISGLSVTDSDQLILTISTVEKRVVKSDNVTTVIYKSRNITVVQLDEKGNLNWYKTLWYLRILDSSHDIPYYMGEPILKDGQILIFVNRSLKNIEGKGLIELEKGKGELCLISISQDGKSYAKSGLKLPSNVKRFIYGTRDFYTEGNELIVPIKPKYSNVGFARITIE